MTLEALGAIPVSMPAPDVYTSLARQTIDGTIFATSSIKPYQIDEMIKYVTVNSNFGGFIVTYCINENVWQAIPETDRQILQEQLVRLGDEAERCVEELDAQILDRWVRSGEITVVEDADIDAFRESVRSSVPDQFVWADTYRLLTH